MTLILRHMRTGDIDEVVPIDQASFEPPWTEKSYKFEIEESTYTYMVVLEKSEELPATGLKRFIRSINSNGEEPTIVKNLIVGYGGLWRITDEAHVSTIAAHPEHRGNRYGEILLAGMIRRSIALGASYIVLEVRVSNTVAQNLYTKYGFKTEDIKKNYYRNGENAYDMRLMVDSPEAVQAFEDQYRTLQETIDFIDQYSRTPHPRFGD